MNYTTEEVLERREVNRKLIKVGDKAIIDLAPQHPDHNKLHGLEVEITGIVDVFTFGFLCTDGNELYSLQPCCFKTPEVQQKGCPFDEPLPKLQP